MKHTHDTVWQRRGTSWIWDEEARNQVCMANEVWSLRQFLQSARSWPEHHAADTGQREYDGQHIGLGQSFGQDIERSGDATPAADDAGSDGFGRPPAFQFFHVVSPQKGPRKARAAGLMMGVAVQASLVAEQIARFGASLFLKAKSLLPRLIFPVLGT